MYNPQIETLIQVADAGSFSKAAEKMYITSVSIMNQINALEKRIGVKLLERTNQGVTLTEAGQSVYHDAKQMIAASNSAIQRARQIAGMGVDKKLWYICLLFLLIVILYYISTGGIHMDDIKSPSAVTIGELSRIVMEFEEKIQNGTEDPNRFLTLTEIEELWGRLIGDTNVLYSDMVQSLIQNIDERGLVRQKKENSRPEE